MQAWCPNCKTWTDTKVMKLVHGPSSDYYVCKTPCKFRKPKPLD